MKKTDEALHIFANGFNCAQAVLTVFAQTYGLDRKLALKIATGMGAGLGFQGKTCGAVLGAYMVISLFRGSDLPNDEPSKEICYNLAREFDKQFASMNGSLECRELLNADLSDPDGYSLALENDLFDRKCPGFVNDAIHILEKIINKYEK